MFQKRWLVLAALVSVSAFAEVSFEEKQNRVEYLEELSKSATSMNIEDYRRELNYEKQGLSLEERAQSETNLLAETIKTQIFKAYEASMNAHGDEGQAMAEIREAIEKDLELADPSLRDELRTLSFEALENAQKGITHTESNLDNVQEVMLKQVQERSAFLNEEGENSDLVAMVKHPSVNSDRDAERRSYNNKSELLSSLVSDRENVRWVTTGGVTLTSTALTRNEARISLQVKMEFLGVGVSAGPMINFKREYQTHVNIMAEGINPVLLSDGNFDFFRRDRMNRIVMSGGKPVRRMVNFNCEAKLEFETDYTGSGGFSVEGVGARTSVSRVYSNSVDLTSRRIGVPEYLAGKTVTYKYLQSLCHMDFLRARVTNTMNVAGSLNIMMRNIVSSLRFSHPKTKCATDNHCINWYNREVIPLARLQNYPRCVEERREKYYSCELRGLKGQNCALYNNQGKRISDGMFEFTCDKGLKCVQYQAAGWLSYAKGKCMPINPRTYISPLATIVRVNLR